MAIRGVALTVTYTAWDTANNIGKTGDSGNHTLRMVRDGAESTPANSPVEVDATNLKGEYKLALTTGEMTVDFITLGGVSTSSGVVIIPVKIATEHGVLPTTQQGNAGAVLTSGSGTGQLAVTGGKTSVDVASINNVSCASVSTVDAVIGTTGPNTPQTGDVFGQLPAHLSALLITAGGHISNVDVLTTYTGNTPQTGDVFSRLPSNFTALGITGIGHIATVDSLLVNADKFGYTLVQPFPVNFALLGITTDGHIANVDNLVTYAGNTPQTGDVFAHLPANFWQLAITPGGHISNVDTVTTYTGNTPQTGDVFAALPGHFNALGITPGGHITNVDALSAAALDAVHVSALTGVPGPTASLADAIGWVYVLARNTRVQTATVETVFADDDTTAIATSAKADTGSVFTRGKYS